MRILFAHPCFPGQFEKIAQFFLQDKNNEIVALHDGRRDLLSVFDWPRDQFKQFPTTSAGPSSIVSGHHLHKFDKYILSATSAALIAGELEQKGWIPDLIYSHAGFATGAFLHNVFPNSVYIKYCEWFYKNTSKGAEYATGPRPINYRISTELLNAPILLDLMRADLMISPTAWQRRQFPPHLRDSIHLLPDGIDTQRVRPSIDGRFTCPDGRTFGCGDKVVTYVGRGADPVRGFKQFLDAMAILQKRDPDLQAIIVGDQKEYYGPGYGTDQHYRSVMAEASFDPNRTHFTGTLPYDEYLKVLQVSAAHVYLTAPFVLSWSALEAMSSGCAVIGSDTDPVREFIDDGVTGLLADFDSPEEIASKVEIVLNSAELRAELGRNARERIIQRWDVDNALQQHLKLVKEAMARRPSVSFIKTTPKHK